MLSVAPIVWVIWMEPKSRLVRLAMLAVITSIMLIPWVRVSFCALDTRNRLLQDVLRQTTLMLESSSIRYRVQGGGLVGVIRFGDSPMGDNDADLYIHPNDWHKLVAFAASREEAKRTSEKWGMLPFLVYNNSIKFQLNDAQVIAGVPHAYAHLVKGQPGVDYSRNLPCYMGDVRLMCPPPHEALLLIAENYGGKDAVRELGVVEAARRVIQTPYVDHYGELSRVLGGSKDDKGKVAAVCERMYLPKSRVASLHRFESLAKNDSRGYWPEHVLGSLVKSDLIGFYAAPDKCASPPCFVADKMVYGGWQWGW